MLETFYIKKLSDDNNDASTLTLIKSIKNLKKFTILYSHPCIDDIACSDALFLKHLSLIEELTLPPKLADKVKDLCECNDTIQKCRYINVASKKISDDFAILPLRCIESNEIPVEPRQYWRGHSFDDDAILRECIPDWDRAMHDNML